MCRGQQGLLLVEASGRTHFLGLSSSGDPFPSFIFIEWVRFPGQRGEALHLILHTLAGNPLRGTSLCTGTVVATLLSWDTLGEA